MAKTRDRIQDVRPYVERAVKDEDVRDTVLRRHGVQVEAVGALHLVATAQRVFHDEDRDRDGVQDFAGGLQELAAAGLIDPALVSGRLQGYTLELCASPDQPTHRWMAIATPDDPHRQRREHLMTNHTGYLYRSDDPFALTPSCDAPPHGRIDR